MKIELTVEELKQLIKITPVGATTDVNLKIGANEVTNEGNNIRRWEE